MPPRSPKALIREAASEQELDVYHNGTDDLDLEDSDTDEKENPNEESQETSSPQIEEPERDHTKESISPQKFEQLDPLLKILGNILRQINTVILGNKVPASNTAEIKKRVKLPRGIHIKEVTSSGYDTCPKNTKKCKNGSQPKKFVRIVTTLSRNKTRAQISNLLSHYLTHETADTFIPVNSDSTRTSFRDLIYVLLGTQKKKKTKKTASSKISKKESRKKGAKKKTAKKTKEKGKKTKKKERKRN